MENKNTKLKQKLTIEEQILDMKSKGITFNYTNEHNDFLF